MLSSDWHIVDSPQRADIKNQTKATVASLLSNATVLLHSLFYSQMNHLDFKSILFYKVPLHVKCYYNNPIRYMYTKYPHLTLKNTEAQNVVLKFLRWEEGRVAAEPRYSEMKTDFLYCISMLLPSF